MVQHVDYFYDAQIRTEILHFGRLMMGFKIAQSIDENGNPVLRDVPCRFLTTDNQVASIISDNSDNVIFTAPMIIYTIDSINLAKERRQDPWITVDDQITEREYDKETQKYTGKRGNAYQVTKMNPRPINITFKVYLITTKLKQKFELLEQISLMFNPAVDMQTSTAPADWTYKKMCRIEENVMWSDKYNNLSSTNAYDTCELKFEVKTWLNPPAIVKKLSRIEQINLRIGNACSACDLYGWDFANTSILTLSPENYYISIKDTKIQLLDAYGVTSDASWYDLFNKYGKYDPMFTQILVYPDYKNENDKGNPVIGTVKINENNHNELAWYVDEDTLPTTNLGAVDAIIDPHEVFPGKGLPEVYEGQRYLILEDIAANTTAWDIIYNEYNEESSVSKFSIIEYDGSKWKTVLNSKYLEEGDKVISLKTKDIYTYMNRKNGFVSLLNGKWKNGIWRIKIDSRKG